MNGSRAWWSRPFLVVAIWLLAASALGAHDFTVVEARVRSFESTGGAGSRELMVELILDLDALLMGVGPDHDPEALHDAIASLSPADRAARIERLRNLLVRRVRLFSGGERAAFTVNFPGLRSERTESTQWAQAFAGTGRSSHLGVVALLRSEVPSDQLVRVRLSRAFGAMRLTAGESGTPEFVAPGLPSSELDLRHLMPPSAGARLLQALVLGVLHIVPRGLDHVLFLIGLALVPLGTGHSAGRAPGESAAHSVAVSWRGSLGALAWAVSMFTMAHAVTLSLAVYDVAGLARGKGEWIEFLIAVSIALVAADAWRDGRREAPRQSWRRLMLVFAFGLVHGLGFASILSRWMPTGASGLWTLMGFHLGVELGQLAVVALVILVLWPCARRRWYGTHVVTPVALVIAGVALFWAWQRWPLS